MPVGSGLASVSGIKVNVGVEGRVRLFSWNVNGIRSVLGKGFKEWLQRENPDIVALQEIKARPEQLAPEDINPLGYHSVWFPAEKPGYSGVAIFSQKAPLQTAYGLQNDAFDCEGRLVQADFGGFTLLNAYFPNSQRDHARLGYKLDFCQHVRTHLDALRASGKNFLLCGDFNIAHKEIDLRNPKQNQENAGFLPEERAWMDSLLGGGYVDVFREFHPEPDQYTWWSYRPGIRERNIGWRLDYFVANPEWRDRLKDSKHHPLVKGSDHCPVEVELKT